MFDFDFESLKKAASNVFNQIAAYQFNEERGFSKKAIKIIRTATGSAPVEWWDGEALAAITRWQADTKRLKPLAADGKFGPKSLGVLIAELEKKGDTFSTAILKQFSYKNVATGQVHTPNVITPATIRYMPNRPLALTKSPTGAWEMRGSFKVHMQVNAEVVEPWRYEYRQYIRGKVILNRPSSEEDMKDNFKVPGGLHPVIFNEDGEVMPSGAYEKFGYRGRRPTIPSPSRPGISDYYTNGQQGADYYLEDTFGIAGAGAGSFHKVSVTMTYRGVVIKDGKELTPQQINSPNWREYCVAAEEWTYDKKDFF